MGLIQLLMKEKKHIDEIDEADLKVDVRKNVAVRPTLKDIRRRSYISPEFGTRMEVLQKLESMVHGRVGSGYGTMLSLPFDQKSSEHGPLHDFIWEEEADAEEIRSRGRMSADIRTIAELVESGKFSAYVLHPGNAEKFRKLFREDVPLIYKIDAHITQPKSAEMPSNVGTIEHAVGLEASAIGATLYPGSSAVQQDLERVGKIVRDAHNSGLAAVVWAYARGPGLSEPIGDKKAVSQEDSLYWVMYSVSIAEGALGADIIKTKFPAKVKPDNREAYEQMITKLANKNPAAIAYKYLEPKDPATELTDLQQIYRMSLVTRSFPGSLIIVSGGPKKKEDPTEELKWQTKIIMDAGAEGGIYGRNIWGVPTEDGLKIADAILEVLRQPQYHRNYIPIKLHFSKPGQ